MTLYCGTHNWLCVQKMLNHGLNHGFFLSLSKLISIYTLSCMCVSLFKFHIWILEQFQCCPKLPALPRLAQTHENMSFIWIVWGTLYVYLWFWHKNTIITQETWIHMIKQIKPSWKKKKNGMEISFSYIHRCFGAPDS